MRKFFYTIASLAIVALAIFGGNFLMVLHKQDQMHIELAKLDVAYAKVALENRKADYERLEKLSPSVVARADFLDAKYAYEQAVIDYDRAQVILKLTEETGRYYGLGGRATVP